MQSLYVSFLLNIGLTAMAFKLVNKVKSTKHPHGFGTAKHAVIIGVDGMGGIYLRNYTSHLPAIQSFFDHGASTTESRNLLPAKSAPNWAGYLTSMTVPQSGVFSKLWVMDDSDTSKMKTHHPPGSSRGPRPQTIFSVLKKQKASAKTSLYFTMSWLVEIAKKNQDIDYWFWGHEGISCGDNETETHCENRQDWNVQQRAIEGIERDQPTLTFIQLESVDAAGHTSHWASKSFYDMLKDTDKKIAGLLEALEKTNTSSDHGGYGNDHGVRAPSIPEIYVPILFRGPGIRKINLDKYELDRRYISTLDAPVTILNALGVKPGTYMRGRVLEEIYED
ncbi:uncharacterized protein LOC114527577 isoform X2 [Dendronephthya gigantea]|uniref:uncharacterized protein LOC114527577 isoform X2 n=1 Tax=Dendronephthya gigantea TaxID=151771 RepID=UPI00106D85DE|nr:uncharacterized protein LOC114527577 isoform X2 [Dendronephthya gigantea]